MERAEPGGLFAGAQRIPLRGVAIRVKVRGVASEVTVAQRYENREKVPVEAVYSFPLQESAAVCGFEVLIGGRRVLGRVEEREKAFDRYDEAIEAGHGAFLVDQDRPNLFTASVGNLLPGQEAIVSLTYVSELEQTGDAIRLLIPTTISPRYVPPEQGRTMDPAEWDRIAPPAFAGGVPYGLQLAVDVEAPDEIREVACASHPARVSVSGRTARVELMGREIQLDQDFVLHIVLAHPHRTTALVAREEGGARVAMLNLFPELPDAKRLSQEVIFVVDRSGSMQGESISQAREALQLCLRALQEGDRFNIVGFGSTFASLFATSEPYGQKTLEQATAHVDALEADLGGTEIMAPLAAVLAQPPREGCMRQVVLLTDGEVSNEADCIALAGRHAATCRIFTFGIGRGASENLIRGLARASRGQAEFIHPNERIEPKVLRQFARIGAPELRNIRVDWGRLEIDLQAPVAPPPLFQGDRATLYARVTGGVPCEVAVCADTPDGPVRFPVFVDLEKAPVDRCLPVLMARTAIRELEEGRGQERGSAQRGRKENRVKSRIRELALQYGLLSSETSMVAIDERTAIEQAAAPELRRIPIALTKGWHGYGAAPSSAIAASPGGMLFQCMASGPATVMGAGTDRMLCDDLVLADDAPTAEPVAGSARPSRASRRSEDARSSDPFAQLAREQTAEGSFRLTKTLAKLAGRRAKALQDRARELGLPGDAGEKVLATLIALHLFETEFADRRTEWALLAKKAEGWLAKQKASAPAGYGDLKAWAAAALKG